MHLHPKQWTQGKVFAHNSPLPSPSISPPPSTPPRACPLSFSGAKKKETRGGKNKEVAVCAGHCWQSRSTACNLQAERLCSAIGWDRYFRRRQRRGGGHTRALVSGLPNYSTHVRTIQPPCPPPREQHAVCAPWCFCIWDSHHSSQLTVSCCSAVNMCWMQIGKVCRRSRWLNPIDPKVGVSCRGLRWMRALGETSPLHVH